MKKITSSVFLLVLALVVNQLHAQVKMYMKLTKQDGTLINGESVVTGFVNWVELNATGLNHTAPFSIGTTGGGAVGKTTTSDFTFQTPVNAASLPLMSIEYTGARLKSVDVWYVKSGCNCAYYKLHMENVFVTGIAEVSGDDSPSQQITFAPLQFAYAYYKQNATTGQIPATPTNVFGWDRAQNNTFTYNF